MVSLGKNKQEIHLSLESMSKIRQRRWDKESDCDSWYLSEAVRGWGVGRGLGTGRYVPCLHEERETWGGGH